LLSASSVEARESIERGLLPMSPSRQISQASETGSDDRANGVSGAPEAGALANPAEELLELTTRHARKHF
jgi:hypothetical protein